MSGGVLTEDRVALVYEASAPTDIDRALADLVALRDAQDALKDWEGVLTDFLADRLGREGHQLPDGRIAQVRRGKDRTEWDHDALIRLVVARGRDERKLDEETGEYEPEGEAVARALMECARPSWRLTPLRARGIDPDEYCASSPGRVSVVIQ